jgi:hypothetical protein
MKFKLGDKVIIKNINSHEIIITNIQPLASNPEKEIYQVNNTFWYFEEDLISKKQYEYVEDFEALIENTK